MKKIWTAIIVLLLLVPSFGTSASSVKWEVPSVGKMELPEHVQFEKGAQMAVPFLSTKGPKLYFARIGASDSDNYTMTYANPPDFSYGWASAQVVSVPFLWKMGLDNYKNEPLETQMDAIAGYINQRIRAGQKDSLEAQEPLTKINDKNHPRWSGYFTTTTFEKGIVYRETYLITLQISGYHVVMFMVVCDGNRPDLVASLQKMMDNRQFWSEKKLLQAYLDKK